LLEETPDRALSLPDAELLLFLRGVNLNPGAEPEDMVSVRFSPLPACDLPAFAPVARHR
jgi:zinc transporter